MTTFEDITLLECNRKQSVQAETDNIDYGIYTNRMGKVIDLNIGDTIELKSAFINQRGCANPNSLEFKGSDIGVYIDLEETQSSKEYPDIYVYSDKDKNIDADPDPFSHLNNPEDISNMGNLAFRQIKNQTRRYSLKDNEMHLEVNYYKSSNGECSNMMPRACVRTNFDGAEVEIGAPAHKVKHPEWPNLNTAPMVWTSSDVEADVIRVAGVTDSGIEHYGYYSGHVFYLWNNAKWLGAWWGSLYYYDIPNRNDYHEVWADTTGCITPTYYKDHMAIPGLSPIDMITMGRKFSEIRPRYDNSKFTLFEREYDWLVWGTTNGMPSYTYNNDDGTEHEIRPQNWYAWTDMEFPAEEGRFPRKWLRHKCRSPALYPYEKVIVNKSVSIRKGFSSPQSVAEQITEQLQEQDTDAPYVSTIIKDRGVDQDYVGYQVSPYSIEYKTSLYRAVYCAGLNTLNSLAFYDYMMYGTRQIVQPDVTKQDGEEAFNWWRAHHNICVKRPDLFVAGRKVNTALGGVQVPELQPPISETYMDPKDPSDNSSFGIPNYIQNEITMNTTLLNNWTDNIVTSWIYNEDNLNMLNELFKVQGQYPELFEGPTKYYADNVAFNNKYFEDGANPPTLWMETATINNSRLLHMNRFNVDITQADGINPALKFDCLGDDGYVQFKYNNGQPAGANRRTYDAPHNSSPVFFKYDINNVDTWTSGYETNNLSYGFATKTKIDGNWFITLHPELCNGIRPDIFAQRGGAKDTVATSPDWEAEAIGSNTCIIGWDYHFNSWGNVVMVQDNGMCYQSVNNEWVAGQTGADGYTGDDGAEVTTTADKYDQTYIGANNTACVFDTTSNRFGFEYLHVPENIGNDYNSGSTDFVEGKKEAVEQFPIIDDAGDEVYKINKRLKEWIFCSDMCPYKKLNATIGAVAVNGGINLDPANLNLQYWTIYDSHMGVNINFGKTAQLSKNTFNRSQQEVWNNSVLGIMGFTYDQFNPEVINNKNNNQARVNYRNIRSIYNPSTNSQIVNTDATQFIMNPYGAVQYTTQLPFGLYMADVEDKALKKTPWSYLPAISQQTQSIKIEGVNLPKVILKPYLTVRSDIISNTKYIGGDNGGLKMPIMAVINKINSNKDYLQLEGSETFTITQPTKFSHITTAICDPSGEVALVDDGSAVIYKITKIDSLSKYDVRDEFVEGLKKSKKKE